MKLSRPTEKGPPFSDLSRAPPPLFITLHVASKYETVKLELIFRTSQCFPVRMMKSAPYTLTDARLGHGRAFRVRCFCFPLFSRDTKPTPTVTSSSCTSRVTVRREQRSNRDWATFDSSRDRDKKRVSMRPLVNYFLST